MGHILISRKTLLNPICMLIVIILLYNFIDVTCILGIQIKYILTKNLFEGGTKKSVLRDHRLSSLVIPNGVPRNGLFHPALTLMIDSYILTLYLTITTDLSRNFRTSQRHCPTHRFNKEKQWKNVHSGKQRIYIKKVFMQDSMLDYAWFGRSVYTE